jgi:bifunctional enzyme CysN/CysC
MGRHKPCVLWFTGRPAAGKSTIARLTANRLQAMGRQSYVLDGDDLRRGLSQDLAFTDADRAENVRRAAEVARLMVDAGLLVLVSIVSPFRAGRLMARALIAPDEFVEIFVDAPLDVAEARDPRGLYRRARAGELRQFTGIDSPYEPPEAPDLHLPTSTLTPEEAVAIVLDHLRERGVLE